MKKCLLFIFTLAIASCIEEETEPMLKSEIVSGERVSFMEVKSLFPTDIFINEEPETTKGIHVEAELVPILQEPLDSVYQMRFYSENEDGEPLGEWNWFRLELRSDGISDISVKPIDLPSSFIDIPEQDITHLVYADTTYTTGWMVIGVWTTEKYSYYRVKVEFDQK